MTNTCENNLKGGKTNLPHGFRGFRPWSAGSIVSGPVLRQSIMVKGMVEQLMVVRQGRERVRETDRD
jgi:hypothetical protein